MCEFIRCLFAMIIVQFDARILLKLSALVKFICFPPLLYRGCLLIHFLLLIQKRKNWYAFSVHVAAVVEHAS